MTPCNVRVITVGLLSAIEFTATLLLFPGLSFLNFCIGPNKLLLCPPLHPLAASTSFKASLKRHILQINVSKFQISGASACHCNQHCGDRKSSKAAYLVAESLQLHHIFKLELRDKIIQVIQQEHCKRNVFLISIPKKKFFYCFFFYKQFELSTL